MKLIRISVLVAVIMSAAAVTVLVNSTEAGAVTVNWTGNGTDENGACSDNTAVSGGTQEWLLILTSPINGPDGPWDLTAHFQVPGDGIITRTAHVTQEQGNGAVHLTVVTPFGALLQDASVTNGSGNSNLTVSHCTPGPPEEETTTTTTTTTPPESPTTTTTQPPTEVGAIRTSTVTAQPSFTG